jgi:DNA-binding CsgD family transcriptional regulator
MEPKAQALCVSLGELIADIGTKHFGAAAFAFVRQALNADHIVANFASEAEMAVLFTEGLLPKRIAHALSQRYLERYYLLDKSLQTFWDIGTGAPIAVRFDPGLNASPAYNAFFFERGGLCDKISLISTRQGRMVFCNLYRLNASGKFTERNLKDAQVLALPLTAAMWLHVERCEHASADPAMAPARPYDELARALESLSPRELQVCQRLLAGASNEGVALDLGIAINSVRTLRKRVYKKLQVNSAADLFSRYLHTVSGFASGHVLSKRGPGSGGVVCNGGSAR